jgi:hypothetical protein
LPAGRINVLVGKSFQMKWERQEQKKKIKKENEKHPDILFFTVSVSLSASAVSRKRIPNQKADVMFEKRKSKK